MALTYYYNILCVISGLFLITTDFVYSSSDSESLCREISNIANVGRGVITVTARNHPMNNPLKLCNILPDNREWFVEIKLYKFMCDSKKSYIKFGYIKLCGESVLFNGRFSSNSMHHNYIKLNSEDQYARITYFRPTDTYYAPFGFARSIPTTKDYRCPSDYENFYDKYRLVTYNLKTKIYGDSLRCLIKYEGLFQARLQFRIEETSFKCLQSRFIFNNKTTVTGNGFLTIDIYEPKIIFSIESGCSVDFALTLTQAVYGSELPKDADGLTRPGDDKGIDDDGCPDSFKKDLPSNKCFSRPSERYLNYEEAKDWCQKQGGELPVVKTVEDLNYFIARAPQIQYFFTYWLGAVRVDSTSFVWEKDYSALNVTNWYEGEPNNIGYLEEDRIQVYMCNTSAKCASRHGKWNDANHRSRSFAICQTEIGGHTQVEPRSGCPAGQYEFLLNTCYLVNNYKSFYNYNNNYYVQGLYDHVAAFCKKDGGQMPGLTETEMEQYFKQPNTILGKCCVRCQHSKPNYGEIETTTRYASNYKETDGKNQTTARYAFLYYKETDGNIETTGPYASNYREIGAVQHLAANSKKVIITAVGCAIVLLFSTALVLYIIIKRRRNHKTKLSLANVYVNPNIQKELTIETVSGKTVKSTGESLYEIDDGGMKQLIMDYEKTDLEEDANDFNC